MFFRQVLHEDLGCASYVIADGGEAVVVDPKWDVDDYLRLAGLHGFALRHVLETHTHADRVSGRARLGLEPFEGVELTLGKTAIRTLPSPGHRPEHRCFLVGTGVGSTEPANEPWALLTGDPLFVGDVARPDLAVDPAQGARDLHATLRRLLQLPEYVEVWPGHIGGSICGGGGMSEKPSSTIGHERRENPWCRIDDANEFVRRLTAGLAPQPPNLERIVATNRDGPPADAASLDALPAARLPPGAVVLDGRDPRDFDGRHIPGAINVSTAFTGVGTRAAWVVEPDDDVYVTGASMVRLLEAAGVPNVRVLSSETWTGPWETTRALDVPALAERLRRDEVVLLDVREDDEWAEGHVEGSVHVPFHDLRDGVPALPDGKPVAVACSAGNRSAIATSLLQRHGVDRVLHVVDGGVDDLADEGISLTTA